MRFGKRYKNDEHVKVESNGLLETLIQCVFFCCDVCFNCLELIKIVSKLHILPVNQHSRLEIPIVQ